MSFNNHQEDTMEFEQSQVLGNPVLVRSRSTRGRGRASSSGGRGMFQQNNGGRGRGSTRGGSGTQMAICHYVQRNATESCSQPAIRPRAPIPPQTTPFSPMAGQSYSGGDVRMGNYSRGAVYSTPPMQQPLNPLLPPLQSQPIVQYQRPHVQMGYEWRQMDAPYASSPYFVQFPSEQQYQHTQAQANPQERSYKSSERGVSVSVRPSQNQIPKNEKSQERENWNQRRETSGGGGSMRFESRPFVHLQGTFISQVKVWTKYKDMLEILMNVYGYMDSDVVEKENRRLEFMLRDETGSVYVSYYEIDAPLPVVPRKTWLKVSCVWRSWGLQAVALNVPEDNFMDCLEMRALNSKRLIEDKLRSINYCSPF